MLKLIASGISASATTRPARDSLSSSFGFSGPHERLDVDDSEDQDVTQARVVLCLNNSNSWLLWLPDRGGRVNLRLE